MTTPRRSKRAREKCSHTHALSTNSGDDDISNFGEDPGNEQESASGVADTKPPKTRQKRQNIEAEQERQPVKLRKPGRYVRGRRGHLKHITEMPMDTLHEVFRQLDPLDLLYLSWASKSLHGIVMEKSARYIWKEVYERLYESNIPPPRCPGDVNFAQYTRFLYYNKCMICNIRNGPHTCWIMRLRVCSHCLVNSNQFVTPKDVHLFLNREWYFSVYANQKLFVFASDAENVGDIALLSDSEREKRRKLRKGKEGFDTWERRCYKDVRDRKRAERRTAIFKKLKEIGWDESSIKEINKGQLPVYLPGLDSGKKLTKKDWEDIRPKIESTLSQMKQSHLDQLKAPQFAKRWNSFKAKFEEWDQIQTLDSSLRPHAMDIAVLEPFNTILFASDIEEAEFGIDDIDHIAKEWIEWRDNFLFSLLPQDLQDHYQANKPLLQSLAIFRFSGRLRNVTLDHLRSRREQQGPFRSLTSDDGKIPMAFRRARLTYIRPWQWSNQDLRFDTKGFEIAVEVLEFLGMDPYTTNTTEMEEYKQMYRCSACHLRPFFNCLGMIHHDWSLHYADIQERTHLATRWIQSDPIGHASSSSS